MSYCGYVNGSMFLNTKDLRIYDLTHLNYQLGVNQKAFAGNDIYAFKKYNSMKNTTDHYIYDGNGIDTYDASNEKDRVTVNLTPGSWIYVGQNPIYY